MREKIVSLSDGVAEEKFAELIGKPASAVADMRKAGKLPIIQMKRPGSSYEYSTAALSRRAGTL